MSVVHIVQTEGEAGQPFLELVGRDRSLLPLVGTGTEQEGLHDERPRVASATDSSSTFPSLMARMLATKPSKSFVFISTTARMSGR